MGEMRGVAAQLAVDQPSLRHGEFEPLLPHHHAGVGQRQTDGLLSRASGVRFLPPVPPCKEGPWA
jgi:hypothetical protein